MSKETFGQLLKDGVDFLGGGAVGERGGGSFGFKMINQEESHDCLCYLSLIWTHVCCDSLYPADTALRIDSTLFIFCLFWRDSSHCYCYHSLVLLKRARSSFGFVALLMLRCVMYDL